MSSFARNLLTEQRKRLVSGLMQHIETQVYPHLPKAKQEALRAKVLQSVGTYHDLCLDLIKASVNDGTTTNEEVLAAIAELHGDVRRARAGRST